MIKLPVGFAVPNSNKLAPMSKSRSLGTDLPVTMTYQTQLRVGQVGRPADQLYFKNPYRGPVWVDEVKFLVQFANDYPSAAFATIATRFKINGQFIVDDYVPFMLLAPHTDKIETFNAIIPSNVPHVFSSLWRLPAPMWLDEQDDLGIELAWLGNLDLYSATPTDPITVTIIVSGRATVNANRPDYRRRPFNVVWGPGILNSNSGEEAYLRSPDLALQNGLNTQAKITRMLSFMLPCKGTDETTAGTVGNVLMNLRLSHSLGYYIIKDLTPYYELFNNLSRETPLHCVMEPKEFVTVELQTLPLTGTDRAVNYLYGFSLQGYSMEKLP